MFDYVCFSALTGAEALNAFSDRVPKVSDIETIAPLFWADHCLECSPPACYASCGMFEANEIGRCRRVDFMELGRVPGFDFPVTHLRFRKWAKLRCPYNASVSYAGREFLDSFEHHEKTLSFGRVARVSASLGVCGDGFCRSGGADSGRLSRSGQRFRG